MLLAACAGSPQGGAQVVADRVTRAVYADRYGDVVAAFDGATAPSVTRASVGALSDLLHRLGDYRGLSLLAEDPAKSEFTFRAAFSHGSVNLAIRLDPDGTLAAYHVFPQP